MLAGVGTLLSFFHQGSLGGLYGVLRGRPFAFRGGFFIWPSTFFPCSLSQRSRLDQFSDSGNGYRGICDRPATDANDVFRRLGLSSGVLLGIYVGAKSIDTLVWLNFTSPSEGFAPWQFYSHKPFGTPVLFAEVCCLDWCRRILAHCRWTVRRGWLLSAAGLACCGILMNRFVMTVQTLALPTLPFDDFLRYTPSWQEPPASVVSSPTA